VASSPSQQSEPEEDSDYWDDESFGSNLLFASMISNPKSHNVDGGELVGIHENEKDGQVGDCEPLELNADIDAAADGNGNKNSTEGDRDPIGDGADDDNAPGEEIARPNELNGADPVPVDAVPPLVPPTTSKRPTANLGQILYVAFSPYHLLTKVGTTSTPIMNDLYDRYSSEFSQSLELYPFIVNPGLLGLKKEAVEELLFQLIDKYPDHPIRMKKEGAQSSLLDKQITDQYYHRMPVGNTLTGFDILPRKDESSPIEFKFLFEGSSSDIESDANGASTAESSTGLENQKIQKFIRDRLCANYNTVHFKKFDRQRSRLPQKNSEYFYSIDVEGYSTLLWILHFAHFVSNLTLEEFLFLEKVLAQEGDNVNGSMSEDKLFATRWPAGAEGGFEKGGFMAVDIIKTLTNTFSNCNSAKVSEIVNQVENANQNGYLLTENKAHDDNCEGGNNVPVSMKCQVAAALLLYYLISEHTNIKGFLRIGGGFFEEGFADLIILKECLSNLSELRYDCIDITEYCVANVNKRLLESSYYSEFLGEDAKIKVEYKVQDLLLSPKLNDYVDVVLTTACVNSIFSCVMLHRCCRRIDGGVVKFLIVDSDSNLLHIIQFLATFERSPRPKVSVWKKLISTSVCKLFMPSYLQIVDTDPDVVYEESRRDIYILDIVQLVHFFSKQYAHFFQIPQVAPNPRIVGVDAVAAALLELEVTLLQTELEKYIYNDCERPFSQSNRAVFKVSSVRNDPDRVIVRAPESIKNLFKPSESTADDVPEASARSKTSVRSKVGARSKAGARSKRTRSKRTEAPVYRADYDGTTASLLNIASDAQSYFQTLCYGFVDYIPHPCCKDFQAEFEKDDKLETAFRAAEKEKKRLRLANTKSNPVPRKRAKTAIISVTAVLEENVSVSAAVSLIDDDDISTPLRTGDNIDRDAECTGEVFSVDDDEDDEDDVIAMRLNSEDNTDRGEKRSREVDDECRHDDHADSLIDESVSPFDDASSNPLELVNNNEKKKKKRNKKRRLQGLTDG